MIATAQQALSYRLKYHETESRRTNQANGPVLFLGADLPPLLRPSSISLFRYPADFIIMPNSFQSAQDLDHSKIMRLNRKNKP